MASITERFKAAASIVLGSGAITAQDTVGLPAGASNEVGFDAGVARSIIRSMDAGDLYATQPHLRMVVSFIARNTAQLGRHVYAKTNDGRERVNVGPAAELLKTPNEYMTGYDLFNMLFSELALYDMAVWITSLRGGKWVIDPIPGAWITGIKGGSAFGVAGYRVKYPDQPNEVFVPASSAVVFRGYSPEGFKRGSSAVRSLQGILEEQVSALEFRRQLWRRGGRVGNFLTRPATAPEWSAEAKAKFIQTWRASFSGDGANAGATPLLEDGMTLSTTRFNAKEEQWLEAATLALSTVAGAYHVPPAMVGVSGYNSFASVKEFRKMLYTETMGPTISQVEDTINTFLFPFIGAPANQYFELNISEKLQGDFEEQGNVLFQAVGGPYMTPDEARSKVNMPKIEGGDKLLTPLNMGAAGNNGPAAAEPIAPAEEPAPDPAAPAKAKAHTHEVKRPGQFSDADLASLETDLTAFFGRQRRATIAALNSKDPSWWNQKKWDQDLSTTLLPHMTALSAGVARETAGAKGLNPDDYSVGRTTAFLTAVAESRAHAINLSTESALEKALDDDEDDDPAAAFDNVFDETFNSRAKDTAKTLGTFVGAWAVTEVARQLVPTKSPTKTWVTSGDPKSRHADIDGETVPLDELFSNGANWPGDPALGAEGVANCTCGVDIDYGD